MNPGGFMGLCFWFIVSGSWFIASLQPDASKATDEVNEERKHAKPSGFVGLHLVLNLWAFGGLWCQSTSSLTSP